MVNHISFPGLGLSFDVNRVLFSIGGIDIYTYGFLIAMGVVLGFIYAFNQVKKSDISQDDFLNMFIIAVPLSVVTARLYYVIFSWEDYKDNLLEILNIRGGGIAIYGAVIGAAATVLIYCTKKHISKGKALDILSVGLLIGQTVGRWGNFVNGEAFGAETTLPWAMTIESGGRIIANSVHPTFLYESIFNLLGIVALTLYKKRKTFEGEVFCGYMIWYGFGRMLIEGLRADSLYLGPFRVSQLLSLCLVVLGVIIIVKNRKKPLTNNEN